MSDNGRPDLAALQELEQLIRALGNEMAAWRRRAHEAEARLKTEETRTPAEAIPAVNPTAVAELERENRELRQRLDAAKQRTAQLLERLRFLRQQHGLEAER